MQPSEKDDKYSLQTPSVSDTNSTVFPHDKDLLKELCFEAGRLRWVLHGTPAGGARVHGCFETADAAESDIHLGFPSVLCARIHLGFPFIRGCMGGCPNSTVLAVKWLHRAQSSGEWEAVSVGIHVMSCSMQHVTTSPLC